MCLSQLENLIGNDLTGRINTVILQEADFAGTPFGFSTHPKELSTHEPAYAMFDNGSKSDASARCTRQREPVPSFHFADCALFKEKKWCCDPPSLTEPIFVGMTFDKAYILHTFTLTTSGFAGDESRDPISFKVSELGVLIGVVRVLLFFRLLIHCNRFKGPTPLM